ncbi:MAG TPA: hypothetical protein VFR76_12885 [Verrucomicrobiae bacterium]|nr:hypothetical protein [Verrucomicrobiae bacterium]
MKLCIAPLSFPSGLKRMTFSLSRKLLFGSPSTSVPTETITRPSSRSVTNTQA